MTTEKKLEKLANRIIKQIKSVEMTHTQLETLFAYITYHILNDVLLEEDKRQAFFVDFYLTQIKTVDHFEQERKR